MIRIDDRLLHGQVAFAWKAYLGYNTVVIASDNASKDEVKKMALKMCCPSDVRLAIRSVDDALVLLRNPKLDKL
uniref:PTS sugar transporter subunit IIB n=2 Tax=Clostridium TaxID=1485 RepID=UPI003BACC4E8